MDAAKPAIRTALVEDQLGLCCYCMGRIEARAFDPLHAQSGTKIEHFVPQSRDESRILDWNNLLGACGGGEGRLRKRQTCDTRKGDTELGYLDPLERLAAFTYGADGRIKGPTPESQHELDEVLNLNDPQLVSNRKTAHLALLTQMKAKLGAGERWSTAAIRGWRQQLAAQRPAAPYLGYLEYWLERDERSRA